MSDPSRVSASPEDLAVAAKQIGFHADEVNAAHGTSLERVESAQAGWVGKSAGALDALGSSWRATTQRHVERLDGLHGHVRNTGVGFEHTDDHEASRIAAVGDQGRAATDSSSGSGVQMLTVPGAGPSQPANPGNPYNLPNAGPGPNVGPRIPDSVINPVR